MAARYLTICIAFSTTVSSIAVSGTEGTYSGFDNKGRVDFPEALKWYSANLHHGKSKQEAGGVPQKAAYKCFHGKIETYPKFEEWLSFDDLWVANQEAVLNNNGGDTQIQHYIQSAIKRLSSASRVDARIILALVMQESSGNAKVACTGETPNCGIMQASYDSHAFDDKNREASILQMIREGVEGTTSGGPTGKGGPGFAQYMTSGLTWVNNPAPGNPYTAARAYNSGTVGGDLDGASSGTKSYANDVANRLIGWDGGGMAGGFAAC